eukprot:TRINITY_DN1430_c0_g1_i1.p1 TRINITY_DN1430_c0_g1~~TRINITY_DN1430_c0_g1_i1.p1  ORF type:complete len:479 (-),score=129.05 TRINITY_DN1430_c0_g1_i1:74-1510(-)
MAKTLDVEKTKQFVGAAWDDSIIPTLCEYIKIPNMSPMFDKEWATNGHVDKVVELFVNWVKAQNVPELELEVLRLEGRTPLLFLTVPSSEKTFDRTVLLYGHLDKQPPLTESWKEGLGPYTPVIKDGKLYGRGGADDGYALFAAITAIKNLKDQGIPHGRAVIIIEASEESGSPDLMPYVHHLKDRIGVPDLIVCLDSGCGNYDQFWLTTSLRGLAAGNLKIEVLKDGYHSGLATGIVPSSFRKLRQVLSKIESEETGEVLVPELHCEIPKERLEQAKQCADALGDAIWKVYPWVEGAEPVTKDNWQLLINRTWKPTIAVTGVDGIPPLAVAGNVLRPYTTVKLSVRLPPRTNAAKAGEALKKALETNPPGCKVSFELEKFAGGWDAPALADWLSESVTSASQSYFGKPPNFLGEGGSIPFMGMLGDMFPQAQFVVTGLLGPESNAHGPNEMLVISMGKAVTACVSQVLRDHYVKFSS